MKRFFRNKFVVLFSAVIILSVVYFGISKVIKEYNFANDEEIIVEEKGEDNGPDDEKNEIREEEKEYSEEEIDLVTEEIVNETEDSEGTKNKENKIYVYVTGEVNSPGVVTLKDGSRIVDAINAAGGKTSKANISKVNLVYVLKDGMKINIPNDGDLKNNPEFEYITMNSGDGANSEPTEKGDTDTVNSNAGGSNRYNIGIVNINTATQTELETLPGIGPSTALKIINYRKENGKFSSIEEIKNVNGIGDNKFEELKKYIKV